MMRPASRWPELTAAGAVPATVNLPWGRLEDATSFVTGLALRALRRRGDPSTAPLRARMLDFLERCEVDDPPGAFAFWPASGRPDWASRVAADADDTAICMTELYLAGRMRREEAVRRVGRLLLPNRVRRGGDAWPPWAADGAFLTWLLPDPNARNIVDCAVNANVLALMAALGMRDPPGARAAVRLIRGGLAWAGTSAARLKALTPFYPEPAELRLAVEHAVACGCVELAPAAAQLRRLTGCAAPGPGAILCSAPYDRGGWRSPALAAIRRACLPEAILEARP
jgi:hypothetical protein